MQNEHNAIVKQNKKLSEEKKILDMQVAELKENVQSLERINEALKGQIDSEVQQRNFLEKELEQSKAKNLIVMKFFKF